ncbi:FkbM family methyltransferase [Roseococcus sp. SYP-B2431]|uniref:FkbM family methyltransferase n=1 Tax=Roseococcus sp. SYP-B2431 TaxID=2496640 RepID=UPI0013F4089F|nr:FkbM family methyltransferase [Roseococcus sp. SYP-B2431]
MANRFLQDLKLAFPDFVPAVAVDVGANSGKSTRDIRDAFALVKILAFEPILKSFNLLQEASSQLEPVVPLKFALSDHKGYGTMLSNGASNGNSFVLPGSKPKTQEDVNVVRGDDFLAAQGVDVVDFIRINTSGSELSVLAGLAGLLRTGNIKSIQVTCAFSGASNIHAPFEKVLGFLAPFGYDLFALNSVGRRSVADRRPVVAGDAAFVHAGLAS